MGRLNAPFPFYLNKETLDEKVIFDNDIGIDDAMALLFLHYSPEVDLVGITTGFGNASADDTARNALFVKEKFGIPAPVYKGANEPVAPALLEEYPDFVHGKNGLGDIDIPPVNLKVEPETSTEAIIKIVKANPNEISIVAVGRMTNLCSQWNRRRKSCPLSKRLW